MVSYPLTFPAQGFSKISFRKVGVGGVSESPYTLSQETITFPGQRWEADVQLCPMTLEQAGITEGFFGILNPPVGTFLMADPRRPVPLGLAASTPGTPVVDLAQATGTTALNVRGAAASKVKYLKAGDYIQLGTGANTRLHQVCQDADTDGSGKTTLTLWPATRYDLTDGAAIVVSGCKGLFRIPMSRTQTDARPGPMTDGSFTAVEAL